LFGSRRRKLHAHEASSGAGLPSRVQRTAFDYGWATQRRASRSARCQTKDQRRLARSVLRNDRLRLTSVGLCIAVSPSHSCSQVIRIRGKHCNRAAWRRRNTSGSSRTAPRIATLSAPAPSTTSLPRNRLRERLCSGPNQLRRSRRPCRRRIPLQEAARSAALDPPVWAAPVVQGRVRKAPLVVAATLQDCMIFWIQRACVYSAGLDQSAIRRQNARLLRTGDPNPTPYPQSSPSALYQARQC